MLSNLLIQLWLLAVALRYTTMPRIPLHWPRLPNQWGRSWTTTTTTRKTVIGIRLQIMVIST